MQLNRSLAILLSTLWLGACTAQAEQDVRLTHGTDESAGGGPAYIITTPSATYYLEKEGGGLSSMLDKEGIDWLGFHNEEGSGHKGEYRGFPNAVHRQDGNYFHAMNAGTDPSSSEVLIEADDHVRIITTSGNDQWQGQWDFYADRCDFKMIKVSTGYKYWIQYEGVPGGSMDPTDFWYSSADDKQHAIEEQRISDLPAPEWMAFGDPDSPRVLFVLHHANDEHPDDYVSRPDMTVLGFGRREKDKFLETPQRFSIGFIESMDYPEIRQTIEQIVESSERS